ncbi:hypothetical protein CEB3_c06510 [Peptococcaceae bacterium CEB3]|nr:hypothetical protein CEB3_c06510 [Peptococcaceae bacterium CEB3]
MPNFKIFQDVPDQARIKIFAGNDVAVNADTAGNLGITSTGLAVTAPVNGLTVTAPASGLSVTPPSGGLSVTPPTGGLAITPPTNGLSITSTGLAVTAPANGLTVTAPASGLSITPPTGGLAITPPTNGLSITSTGLAVTAPANGLMVTAPASGLSITPPASGLLVTGSLVSTVATTDVSATRANIVDTGGTPDTTYDVLGVRTWTFGVVNNSTAANAQAHVKLQISPDAAAWQDDPTGTVTISQNGLATFVSSIFLKYARLYYSAVNAASAVTLNIFYQGQL